MKMVVTTCTSPNIRPLAVRVFKIYKLRYKLQDLKVHLLGGTDPILPANFENRHRRLLTRFDGDGALYICLHFYIIPILFLYFLACHPYILFHF